MLSRAFNNLPISIKLIALALVTTLVALITAVTAILVYNQYAHAALLQQDLGVIATQFSNRNAQAVFDGDTAAIDISLTSLSGREAIEVACIYRAVSDTAKPDIRLMAFRPSADECPRPDGDQLPVGLLAGKDHYAIIEPVILNGSVVGYVHLRMSLKDMQRRLEQSAAVFLVVSVFATAMSLLLAVIFSARLLRPLTELGKAARLVAREENYSLRVQRLSNDEVGEVVESFNQMLEVIEQENLRLRESEEKFRLISETSKVGIFQLNTAGECIYVNGEMSAITGLHATDILKHGWLSTVHEDDRQRAEDQLRLLMHSGRAVALDVRLQVASHVKWISGHINQLLNADGTSIGYLGTIADISDLKEAHGQLEQMAFYDTLTGLANRRLFRNRLEYLLANLTRGQGGVALMLIDLDHFKNINDTRGHDSGDDFLCEVADRLRGCVRQSDTVARLGGDEFAIIIANSGDSLAVSAVASKVRDVINRPFVCGGQEMRMTTSIGISLAPDDGRSAEQLIKNADLALYQAKDEGRDNFKFFTREMNTRLVEHLSLIQDLRTALEHNQFFMQYQPQINLANGSLVGFEALIRWQHPNRGLVSPAVFIPIVEETDMIIPLGRWILRAACKELRRLNSAELVGSNVVMTVNLSVKQLLDEELAPYVKTTLQEFDLQPHQLELELTETMLMENLTQTVQALQRIKDLGVSISIDDFGTGYSSLGYLKRLPVNLIKVDRSFVMDIPDDRDDMEITAAVIAMAHKLGYKVVAEGVETQAQLDFLRRSDCDYGQGFLFSKAIDGAVLDRYCQALRDTHRDSAPQAR